MLLLYSIALVALGAARWLWAMAAQRLESRFAKLSTQVNSLAGEISLKPGNGSRPDPIETARRTFELGKLVQKRDTLEARLLKRISIAEKLGWWMQRLRSFKGTKLPYTMGAVDVWLALTAIDLAGFGQYVNARVLLDYVIAWIQQ